MNADASSVSLCEAVRPQCMEWHNPYVELTFPYQLTPSRKSLVDMPKGLSALSSGQLLLTMADVNSHGTQTEGTKVHHSQL